MCFGVTMRHVSKTIGVLRNRSADELETVAAINKATYKLDTASRRLLADFAAELMEVGQEVNQKKSISMYLPK